MALRSFLMTPLQVICAPGVKYEGYWWVESVYATAGRGVIRVPKFGFPGLLIGRFLVTSRLGPLTGHLGSWSDSRDTSSIPSRRV